MHFDLIDLRLFLNTLDSGNITAGAERSHLSLAAASARIRALEASLGTPLLERGRRGITPTAAGKALGQHSRVLMQQVEHLQFDLAQYTLGVQGQVRLLCNTSALTEYLPELVGEFLQRYPGIDLDIQEQHSLRIVHSLRQGAAELGIVSNVVDTEGLQTRPFRDDPLMLVMPLAHPLAQASAPTFIDSLAHGHVALNANSALAIHIEHHALNTGRRLPVRVRAEGFDGVIRMVAQGAGLGIVTLAAVKRWQALLQFRAVALKEPWADRQLLLCAQDFEQLPGHARALVDSLHFVPSA
ncbi:MAG: LysR substrate-binding domain-containing protein [Pseudomonas sp.]|uniref:LysR substrate-binding domain-containing protein n=1 Tax=Pseudomonas abieticivorans TaxID=2931382 RepID=UPI0020BDFAE5|nr:LysR substrate-binding domain-containing protein [Pseudomonas sp. PIA16]MDE1169188.1 LysR substrate-binding domain-containing protein [Pseudomonas sp.]